MPKNICFDDSRNAGPRGSGRPLRFRPLQFAQMESQNPQELPHCGGTAVDAVSGMNDHFACGVVEMTAGIRHDAVAAAGMVGLMLIADNRMIDKPLLHGGI